MIKLAISGCKGRMGTRITLLALEDQEFKVTTLLEAKNHPQFEEKIAKMSLASDTRAVQGCDVLIEFTTPEATLEHLEYCAKNKIRMVIGTTGLSQEQTEKIRQASKKIAVVYSSNMSVGVNILFKLTKELARKATDAYLPTIWEAHHIHKKDSPSGTAKTLAKIIEENSAHRIGNIDSLRQGEIVGNHKVTFESPDDVIVIEHRAKTRDIFAKGALVAAKFIMQHKKGLFTMQDVLGMSF